MVACKTVIWNFFPLSLSLKCLHEESFLHIFCCSNSRMISCTLIQYECIQHVRIMQTFVLRSFFITFWACKWAHLVRFVYLRILYMHMYLHNIKIFIKKCWEAFKTINTHVCWSLHKFHTHTTGTTRSCVLDYAKDMFLDEIYYFSQQEGGEWVDLLSKQSTSWRIRKWRTICKSQVLPLEIYWHNLQFHLSSVESRACWVHARVRPTHF